MGRLPIRAAASALGLFVAIQLVPYGWKRSNPPVVADAPWPTPAARSIARASCYDCHSNETKWSVQSWLIHSSARLTAAERADLVAALAAMDERGDGRDDDRRGRRDGD